MIYLDLDGVLADFNGYIETVNPGCLDSAEETTKTIIKYHKECFRKSEILKENVLLLKDILDSKNFMILTALPSRKRDIPEDIVEVLRKNKIFWCKKYLNIDEDKIIVTRGVKEKFLHLKEGDTLCDDNLSIIKQCKKLGINGIHVVSNRLKDRV